MKRCLILRGLLALCAFCLLAQQASLAQPPPDNAIVAGTVLNRETKAPVAGAVVVLLPAPTTGSGVVAGHAQYGGGNQVHAQNRQIPIQGVPQNWNLGGDSAGRSSAAVSSRQPGAVATDAKGQFTFEKVEEGEYLLQVIARGFMQKAGEACRAGGAAKLEIALDPFKFVRGRIVKSDGSPLASALINITLQPRESSYGGWYDGAPSSSPITNAKGEFRALFRQPGEHTLTVTVPKLGIAGPKTITTKAGEDLTGIELQLRPAGFVAGKVVRKRTGQPVAGASVNLQGGPPGISLSATTDDVGEFAIPNVPAGSYTVYCQCQGFVQPRYGQGPAIRVGEGQRVDDVAFELSPQPKLTGRILRPDGNPLANQNNLQIRLNIQTPQGPNQTSFSVNTDANGAFPPPQPQYLSLPGFGPAMVSLYLQDVGFGAQRLRLVEGEDPAPLQLQLQAFGSVAGLVRDRETKKPIPGASVNLSVRWGNLDRWPRATTDAQGQFVMNSVQPGLHSAGANLPGYRYTSGREVPVKAGEKVEGLVLEMTKAPAFTGQVLHRDGETPLPGATVRFGSQERKTDGQGAFTFEDASWGSVVTVQAPDLAPITKPLVYDAIQPDRPEPMKVVMRYGGGRLSGTVRHADNKQPAAGAIVVAWDHMTRGGGYNSPLGVLRNLEAYSHAWNPGNDWVWRELAKFAWARTEADGRYQIEHLAEGEYTVYAVAPDSRVARMDNVAVTEGGEAREVDLALKQRRTVQAGNRQITGRLMKADGTPLANTEFRWALYRGSRQSHSNQNRTDASGGYTLSLQGWTLLGAQTLQVTVRGFKPARREGLAIPEDKPLDQVDFKLEDKKTGTITGTVLLPDGKEPAEGLRVIAFGGRRSVEGMYGRQIAIDGPRGYPGGYSEGTVLTDEEGRYRLEDLEPQTYAVVALLPQPGEAVGLPEDQLRNAAPAVRENVVVAEGKEVEVNLTLPAAGTVSGTVVDANGEPVSGASVSAQLPKDAPRLRSLLVSYRSSNAFADERGQFQLQGIPPGTWDLSASYTDHKTRRLRGTVVKAGEETGGVNFRLAKQDEKQKPKWAVVTGRVLMPDGNPAEQARVLLGTRSGWYGPSTDVTGPDGRFTLPRVYPGTIRLTAWKVGYAWSKPIGLSVQPGDTKEGVTLTLQRGSTVEGQVAGEDGKAPADETFVWAVPAEERLGSLYPDYESVRPGRMAGVDDRGRFTLTNVAPGETTLVLVNANGAGWDLKRGVTLKAGEKVSGVSLRWQSPKGVLSGTVTRRSDGKSVANARVYVYNELLRGYFQGETATDEEGRFILFDLPPGTYRVSCDATGLAGFARAGIVVDEDRPTKVDFELLVGGSIAGKVTEADGATPVEGATVYSYPDADDMTVPATLTRRVATTDEEGTFELANLAPGQYEVCVVRRYGAEQTKQVVTVKDAETVKTQVRIQ